MPRTGEVVRLHCLREASVGGEMLSSSWQVRVEPLVETPVKVETPVRMEAPVQNRCEKTPLRKRCEEFHP